MATKELQTLNSVFLNKDIGILYGGGAIDDLFQTQGDVWEFAKDYHANHGEVPGIAVVQEKFPHFEAVPVDAKTDYYLGELRNEFIKGRMDEIMTLAAQNMKSGRDASSKVLSKIQESLLTLNKYAGTAQDLNLMDFDNAERHYEDVKAKALKLGGLPGIPTGVAFIDSAYTSGLAGGDLVVVLGWTGRAKSLFTTLVACNAHDKGFVPMIASMEMSGQKVRDRVYTIKGSGLFTNSGLGIGDIEMDTFRKFASSNENKSDFIVISSESGSELTPNIIESKIDQHHPQVVIIDYAQLGADNAHSENMTQRMMNMSKEYKRLAVKKNIAIMLISSATAESASSSDVPPTIEQVAWSRQLAYDADLAFAVHKYDNANLIEIVCRKNRNGPLFSGTLDWDIDNGIIKEM